MAVPTTLALSGRDWTLESGVVAALGNWTYPLVNMLDPRPSIYTQTTSNASTTNTRFSIDLGVARRIDVLWFVYLFTSIAGTINIVIGNDATFAVNLQTISSTTWPIDSTTTDNWGDSSTNGHYIDLTYEALYLPRIFRLASTVTARYIRVIITDTGNATPIRIGKFGVSELLEFQFRYNWQPTFLDESTDTIALSGTTYTDVRRRKRRLNFGFAPISDTAMFGKFFDWLMWKGQSEPFLILPFADSGYTSRWEKLGFYGKRSNAPSFTNPFVGYYDLTLQVDEF